MSIGSSIVGAFVHPLEHKAVFATGGVAVLAGIALAACDGGGGGTGYDPIPTRRPYPNPTPIPHYPQVPYSGGYGEGSTSGGYTDPGESHKTPPGYVIPGGTGGFGACTDGATTHSAGHKGACSDHGGLA